MTTGGKNQSCAVAISSKSDGFVIVGENHFIGATVGVECSRFIVLLQPFDDVFGEEAAFEEAFYFPRNESALDDKVLGDFHSTETFTLNFILLH